ncbi:MAG TPA: ATP-binding cassette domain-containing protein [Candidatus Eisenbergiella intestinipullorum]|nr:ATP-binding cassette domain-containing protein [Candidatus Eisenbergiella intestinipullorum]
MLLDTAILVISPLLKIYATAEFIDASIRLLSEEASLTDALFPIAVVVLVSGYSYLEKSVSSIVAIRLTAKLRVIYGSMRMDKMAAVAYHNIEDPNVLELLKRTEDDGEIICKIYQSMLNAVVLLAQILSVFAAIMTASLLTGLIVLAVSLPLMKIAAKSGKREYDLEKEEAACKRRYEYFYELLSGRDSVEERTLFQYGPFMEKHMLKFYEMFRKKSIVVTIRNNINVEGGSIVTSLFSEVMSLTETMSWGFAGAISELTNNHQKLKDIDAFFGLPEEETKNSPVNRMPGIPTITFRDVWFKYPNTDRYILQGLSFSVSAGSHYAFVGKNGAGKSTVIKLLMGLYRDYEGEILIDGKELREYPVEELRKLYAVIILQHATNGIGHSVIPALKLKLDREALVKLERKVRDVPAEWFEHREFLDFLEKAYKGTGYCFALLVPMLRFLFKYGPYCVLMGLYLKRYDPVLALCVVLIFIPAFASMVIRPDLIFELEDHAVLARRMDAYLKKCVGGPEYFKETRTLGISGYFKTKFLENVKLLNGYIWKAQKKIKLVELMTTLFSVFGYGGVMVLLVVSLLRGRITTALYASVFSSITLMYAMCDDAAYHFLSPFDGVAIVNSFVALIKGKLPERKDRPVDFSKPIVAEDITFSYPGTDKPALDHVSFRVRAGETIAIVGNNGSGKTTLSKILLGIYTPKSGSVKIGDVDIGEISSKSVGVGI